MSGDSGLRRTLLRTANRLGLGSPLVTTYDVLTEWTDFDVDQDVQSTRLAPEDRKGAAFIPLIQGHSPVNAYRHCILAHAFRTRGYEPLVLLCRSGLDLCLRKEPDWTDDSVCDVCHHYGERMLDDFGLTPLSIESVLTDVTYPSVDEFGDVTDVRYEGVDVSRFATVTLRKFLLRYHVDVTGEDEAFYRGFLRSGLRLAAATAALLDEYDVHVTLGHDHKYVYGGIPLAVSTARDVPAYSHSLGYQDQTMLISNVEHRSSFPQYERPEVVETELDTPLTDRQAEEIETLMSERASGEATRHVYSSTSRTGVETADPTVVAGMFTNLIWDASLAADAALFGDVFDWIETTVRRASDCDDLRLLVKCHPAEAKRGTNESVAEWIQRRFDPLPDNVDILPPDTDVDTYQMIRDLDVGFVYNSTVGLEMAYEGTPVVVGGDTHYKGFDFTIDPTDVDEYCRLIDDAGDLRMSNEMQRRARRYAYFLFVQKHLSFPFYRTNQRTLEDELLPVTNGDVAPGASPFDFLVERCLGGDPVFYTRRPDREASPTR